MRDYGFTTDDDSPLKPSSEWHRHVDAIESLVLPLLQHLQTDPDKATIRWPDRASQMAELEKAFVEIANSMRVITTPLSTKDTHEDQ